MHSEFYVKEGNRGTVYCTRHKVFSNYVDAGPNYLGGKRFKKEYGGDLGSPKGEGWIWYESTGEGFSDWSVIPRLTKGTIVGLKYSLTQKDKHFVWNGVKYDPANPDFSPPRGFVRMHGGDLCAPKDEGYYRYEEITDSSED